MLFKLSIGELHFSAALRILLCPSGSRGHRALFQAHSFFPPIVHSLGLNYQEKPHTHSGQTNSSMPEKILITEFLTTQMQEQSKHKELLFLGWHLICSLILTVAAITVEWPRLIKKLILIAWLLLSKRFHIVIYKRVNTTRLEEWPPTLRPPTLTRHH